MKKLFNLPSNLRVVFGSARAIYVPVMILACVLPFVPRTGGGYIARLLQKFPASSSDPDLAAAIDWTMLLQGIDNILVAWFVLGILQNLCGRIAIGDVFSAGNLRSVKNLGLVLVLDSLVSGALTFWSIRRLRHLMEPGYVPPFAPIVATGIALIADFPWRDLITGLLVLLVAEAFRQGLALKNENELTV